MSASSCSTPISFEALVDFWFGELAANEEERVEEHLLACAVCSRRLGSLVTLGAGIRSAFRNGALGAVISPALLDEMKREGLRLREYLVGPRRQRQLHDQRVRRCRGEPIAGESCGCESRRPGTAE
jgi:hypothetical protein